VARPIKTIAPTATAAVPVALAFAETILGMVPDGAIR